MNADKRTSYRATQKGQRPLYTVKFVPKPAAKTATWPVAVTSGGNYRVYAKWPALPANGATDAPYAVTHAGGTTTVTANQRINGGQWNLLGSFTFNSGTNYKIELSDQAAVGTVAADAIYLVRDVAPTDLFTWTPAFSDAGTFQVFARWPASSGNTVAATYTVTHAGGSANTTANQRQNGGAWTLLGSWSFTPGAGHKVTLAGAPDGTTIADALLFVGTGGPPANLYFVHADHLGSPQKITDAAQAIVWDGVFDPFGEEIAIAGLAAMPMRFPGQYADDETGYSYNYFRDYEPKVGRYLQSDPIGLLGGINLYAYVEGNPNIYVDPTGERAGALGGAALIGAVAGVLESIAWQMIVDGKSWNCLDWREVGVSGALGGLGGGLGAVPSVFKRAGQVFSHWVPDRYLRLMSKSGKSENLHYKPWLDNAFGRWLATSPLNGRNVTKWRHFKHDPFYYGTSNAYLEWGRKWRLPIQQFDRVPYWIWGGLTTPLFAPAAVNDDACECR